jgi:hypothetical protein
MANNEPGVIGTTLNDEILKETSPELAIKVAYDFGRKLARQDVLDVDDALADHVDPSFRGTSLYIYVRAGFISGLSGTALPWRRDIEAEAASAEIGAASGGAVKRGNVDLAHK